MALKVFDGFDHYASKTDLLARSGFLQWQEYGTFNGPSYAFISGANGEGKALKLTGLGWLFSNGTVLAGVVQSRLATAFAGWRVLCNGPETGFGIAFWDTTTMPNPTCQLSVLFSAANYSISIYRGGYAFGTFWSAGSNALLAITGNNAWAGDTANFIEIWPVINSSSGSVEVIVNGQTLLTISGVNTKVSSNTWWDAVSIVPEGLGNSALFREIDADDFYYCDTSVGPGSYPCDTPLGDVHVYTRFPIGNASIAWTPLANSNWQEVDEPIMDGDTSYNFTSTPGNEDLLNFGSLANTINRIIAVQVTGAYRKDDAGTRQVKQAIKSGSSETYGATYSLPVTNYVYFTDLFVLDPATSASWTLTAVNNTAAGYNLVA